MELKEGDVCGLVAVEIGNQSFLTKAKLSIVERGKVKVELSADLIFIISDRVVGPRATFEESKDVLLVGAGMALQLDRQWKITAQALSNMGDGRLQGNIILEFTF